MPRRKSRKRNCAHCGRPTKGHDGPPGVGKCANTPKRVHSEQAILDNSSMLDVSFEQDLSGEGEGQASHVAQTVQRSTRGAEASCQQQAAGCKAGRLPAHPDTSTPQLPASHRRQPSPVVALASTSLQVFHRQRQESPSRRSAGYGSVPRPDSQHVDARQSIRPLQSLQPDQRQIRPVRRPSWDARREQSCPPQPRSQRAEQSRRLAAAQSQQELYIPPVNLLPPSGRQEFAVPAPPSFGRLRDVPTRHQIGATNSFHRQYEHERAHEEPTQYYVGRASAQECRDSSPPRQWQADQLSAPYVNCGPGDSPPPPGHRAREQTSTHHSSSG